MVADPGRQRPKAWDASFWQTCDAGSSWAASSVVLRKCGLYPMQPTRSHRTWPTWHGDLTGQTYPASCARIEVRAAYLSVPDGQLNEQVAQTGLRAPHILVPCGTRKLRP